MTRIFYPKDEVACNDAFVQGSCRLTRLRGLSVINKPHYNDNDCDGDDYDDDDDDDDDDGDDDDASEKYIALSLVYIWCLRNLTAKKAWLLKSGF